LAGGLAWSGTIRATARAAPVGNRISFDVLSLLTDHCPLADPQILAIRVLRRLRACCAGCAIRGWSGRPAVGPLCTSANTVWDLGLRTLRLGSGQVSELVGWSSGRV